MRITTHERMGDTRKAVWEILQREADMDGLVIIASTQIAEELGMQQPGTQLHIRALIDSGHIEEVENPFKSAHMPNMRAYQITEF